MHVSKTARSNNIFDWGCSGLMSQKHEGWVQQFVIVWFHNVPNLVHFFDVSLDESNHRVPTTYLLQCNGVWKLTLCTAPQYIWFRRAHWITGYYFVHCLNEPFMIVIASINLVDCFVQVRWLQQQERSNRSVNYKMLRLQCPEVSIYWSSSQIYQTDLKINTRYIVQGLLLYLYCVYFSQFSGLISSQAELVESKKKKPKKK